MTDAQKLRTLADWLYKYDQDRDIDGSEAQKDLHRIADEIDAAIGNYASYPLSKEASEILTAEVERRTIKAESFSAENGVKVLMFWYKTN